VKVAMKMPLPSSSPVAAVAVLLVLSFGFKAYAEDLPAVEMGGNGRLIYSPDSRGNRIPDFSHAGYRGGGVQIPQVEVREELEPVEGDNRKRIQAAIERVSALPLDAAGVRGAVLLKRGVFEVGGTLAIQASGVVLRGEGVDEITGTTLRATAAKKGILLEVSGTGDYELMGPRHDFRDKFVPCGAATVAVKDLSGLVVGDRVLVQRHGTKEWITAIGMDRIPANMRKKPDGTRVDSTKQWESGDRESYDRMITAIDGPNVTLNATLPSAFGLTEGTGTLQKYRFPGRISQVGVENLRMVSAWKSRTLAEIRKKEPAVSSAVKATEEERFDDLQHLDKACRMNAVEDCWVRNVTVENFYTYAIQLDRSASAVTVQDCISILPDPGVFRIFPYVARSPFSINGQKNLFQRCLGVNSRHTFVVGWMVGGPNVFLDCDAEGAIGSSEAHQRWSTGILFDSLGHRFPSSIDVINRGAMGSGHGWAGANCVIWNCIGGKIRVEVPPTAFNLAIACRGTNDLPLPPAYVSWGLPASPRSLYLQQLGERAGEKAVRAIAKESQLREQ
jgi:hypothetical protein